MTISTNRQLDELLWIGTRSTEVFHSSTSGPPFLSENVQLRVGLPANTSALDEFVTELERDPGTAERFRVARRELGVALDQGAQETLPGIRLAAGLSQTQLAHAVGTSQSHIARIELGQTDPSTDLIARVAQALGVEDYRVFRAIRFQRDLAA